MLTSTETGPCNIHSHSPFTGLDEREREREREREIAPIRICIICLYDYLVLSRYNTTVFDIQ